MKRRRRKRTPRKSNLSWRSSGGRKTGTDLISFTLLVICLIRLCKLSSKKDAFTSIDKFIVNCQWTRHKCSHWLTINGQNYLIFESRLSNLQITNVLCLIESRRVSEVFRLLQSSRPIILNMQQRPEMNNHDFQVEREKCLRYYHVRRLALPIGRGKKQ